MVYTKYMQILIRATSNTVYPLAIHSSRTGRDLLELISTHEKIPLEDLRAVHQSKPLRLQELLLNQGIRTGSSLTVSLKIRGGGCLNSRQEIMQPELPRRPRENGLLASVRKQTEEVIKNLLNAIKVQDSPRILQGLKRLERIELEVLPDSSSAASRLMTSICKREIDTLHQPIKERVLSIIPTLLYTML